MLLSTIYGLALVSAIPTDENPVDYIKIKEPDYNVSASRISYEDDSYSITSGSVILKATDISIPTNSKIPFNLSRWVPDGDYDTGGPSEWKWDIPFIKGNFLGMKKGHVEYGNWFWGRRSWNAGYNCSGFPETAITNKDVAIAPGYYWDGITLHIPGQATDKIQNSANARVTKSNFKIKECISIADGQEGFVVQSPDGLTYTFAESKTYDNGRVFLKDPVIKTRLIMVSKVEDQFGNSVVYNYQNSNLISITAKTKDDLGGVKEQKIAIEYSQVGEKFFPKTASYEGRTWKYFYSDDYLKTVELPNGRSWNYTGVDALKFRANKTNENYSNTFNLFLYNKLPASCSAVKDDRTVSVIDPEGRTTNYKFSMVNQDRAQVEPEVVSNGAPNKRAYTVSSIHCALNFSLVQREVLVNDQRYVFDYVYSQNLGTYKASPDNHGLPSDPNLWVAYYDKRSTKLIEPKDGFPSFISESNSDDYRTVTVKEPALTRVFYIDRRQSSPTENFSMAEDVLDTNGNLLQRLENQFSVGAKFASSWLECPCGIETGVLGAVAYNSINLIQTENHINPSLKNTSVLTNGNTKNYLTYFDSYNKYGRVTSKRELDPNFDRVKYTKYKYIDLESFINLPYSTEVSSDGVNYTETLRNEYFTSGILVGLEKQKFNFKSLHMSSEYYQNGLLKKLRYGKDQSRWIGYSNYEFGSPSQVSLADPNDPIKEISAYYEFDSYGNVNSITDFEGDRTNYQYDAVNRLTYIDPEYLGESDTSIEYSYNSGYLIQTMNKGNLREVSHYDNLLRQIHTSKFDINSPQNAVFINKEYDYRGNVTFESLPSSTVGQSNKYDALGRIVKSTRADGKIKTYEYKFGNQITTRDYRGNSTQVSHLSYGTPGAELPIYIVDANESTTELSYNIFGKIMSISQGGFREYRLYDNSQRLCLVNRPDVGTTAYSYNSHNEVSFYAEGLTNKNSCIDVSLLDNKISLSYFNNGLLRRLSKSDGSGDINYSYDNSGALKSLSTRESEWKYLYNTNGTLLKEILNFDGKEQSITYSYDNLSNLKTITYPSGMTIDYAPNALGQATVVGNHAKQIEYFPNGKVKQFKFGNGLQQTFTLNSNLAIEKATLSSGITKLIDFNHQYDENMNFTSIHDTINQENTLSMTYDNVDRLKTSNGKFGSLSFSYSNVGNITKKIKNGNVSNYLYGVNDNLLKSVTGYEYKNFEYDSRGNVINNGRFNLSFDQQNNLLSANGFDFTYDGHGRRVKSANAAGATYSTYNKSGRLVRSLDNKGKSTEYIYLGNQLIAQIDTEDDEIGQPSGQPSIDLYLSVETGSRQCLKTAVPCGDYGDVHYYWESNNAQTCEGTLQQLLPAGPPVNVVLKSGISLTPSIWKYWGASSGFSLIVTCHGAGGSTTKTITDDGLS